MRLAPRGGVKSADFDRAFSSEPRSVDSGVYGLGLFFTVALKSSLLITASLLYVLLKLGYGRLLLEVAPGADVVRPSSGTTSAIEEAGSDSFSLSLSLSLSFRRRCDDRTASPVSGSMIFSLELLDDLWGRLGSFSLFIRRRLSLGLSSASISRSW